MAQATYTGVDVVFLIGQHASMNGQRAFSTERGNTTGTDPDGRRYDALTLGMELLGGLNVQQSELGNLIAPRASVVYFGDNNFADIGFHPLLFNGQTWLNFNQTNQSDWENKLNEIRTQVSSTRNRIGPSNYPNLGNRNFVRAFELALENLNQLEPDPNRLQIILFLTDGAPCAPSRNTIGQWNNLNCSPAERGSADKTRHLQTLLGERTTKFNAPNQRVYAVGLNAENGNDRWEVYEPRWRDIADEVYTLASADSLARTFSQIIAKTFAELRSVGGDESQTLAQLAVAGSNNPQSFTKYTVLPFQQTMVLTFIKSRANATPRVIQPTGVVLERQRVRVVGTGAVETWVVNNPLPGSWSLSLTYSESGAERADEGGTVFVETAQAQFTPQVPAQGARYAPLRVALRVSDDSGNNMPAYDERYELVGQLRVRTPSGATETLAVRPLDDSLYGVDYLPKETGDYRFSFEVSSGAGNQAVAFNNADRASRVSVAETRLTLTSIPDQLLQNTPFEASLDFVDSSGVSRDINAARFELALVPIADGCNSTSPNVMRYTSSAPSFNRVTILAPNLGEYEVCLSVSLNAPDGLSAVVANRLVREALSVTQGIVKVESVVGATLQLNQPTKHTTSVGNASVAQSIPDRESFPTLVGGEIFGFYYPFFLYWQPTTVDIELQAVQTEGNVNSVPVGVLLPRAEADGFVSFQMIDETRGNREISESLGLKPRLTGDPSKWVLALPPLEQGSYRLLFDVPQRALGKSRYAFASGNNILELQLGVYNNIIPIVMVGAMFLSLLAFGLFVARPFWVSAMTAAKGELKILKVKPNNAGTEEVRSYPLSKYNTSERVFSLAEIPLDFPPMTGLKVISNRALRREDKIIVEAEVNGVPIQSELSFDDSMFLYEDGENNQYIIRRRL
jgi:hypothetical protein